MTVLAMRTTETQRQVMNAEGACNHSPMEMVMSRNKRPIGLMKEALVKHSPRRSKLQNSSATAPSA